MADDLHDLIDGPGGAARGGLIVGLLERGCTPQEIRAAHERGRPIDGSALDDHARRLHAALAAGMPLEALLTINRVIGG